MPTFYCTADGLGPFLPVDWSALPAAARRACASHLIAHGAGPCVVEQDGNHLRVTLSPTDVATALASARLTLVPGAEVDGFGGGVASVTDGTASAELRCPDCLAPVRVVEDAPAWEPPADLPPDPALPAPKPVYKTSAPLVTNEAAVSSLTWQTLGRITTAVGGLVTDVSRAIGAIVGEVEANDGIELQLVAKPVGGAERVLLTAAFTGDEPYVQKLTAVGAPERGPCAYILQGRKTGAQGGVVRGVSLALYEVPL